VNAGAQPIIQEITGTGADAFAAAIFKQLIPGSNRAPVSAEYRLKVHGNYAQWIPGVLRQRNQDGVPALTDSFAPTTDNPARHPCRDGEAQSVSRINLPIRPAVLNYRH